MLRGVVALCYGVDNKVPKLIAWRRGNIQIGSCKMGNCVEKVKNHWLRYNMTIYIHVYVMYLPVVQKMQIQQYYFLAISKDTVYNQ